MLDRLQYCLPFGFLFLFLFLLVQESRADQFILSNGDSLSGTLETVADGKLTLKTDYAGPIKIDVTKIMKISSTSAVEVHLQNGEILKGKLTATEDGQVIVEKSGERGKTSIEWKNVASINPARTKWTGSITVGGNTQTGNTHRYGASFVLDASRRTETDRFSLGYLFNYAHEDAEVTTRNHYGHLKYDYFLSKIFYGLLGMELLSDTFRDLDLRTAVGPGIGYQVWDDTLKSLSFEAGVSYVNEAHKLGKDIDFLTARLAADCRYKIADFITFTDRMNLYPRLDYIGRYLIRNEAALVAPVGSGWAMRFANILERDSNPPAGVNNNDLQWVLGLQYSF